jgi:hypothetical protein
LIENEIDCLGMRQPGEAPVFSVAALSEITQVGTGSSDGNRNI